MAQEFGLSFRVIESFFDTARVKNAMDATTRKRLSKAGSFVRQAARSRIRRRKQIAAPGQSPSSHEGGLKKGILFAYDARNQSVVVGPVRHNAEGGRIPALLEFGGTITREFRADLDDKGPSRWRAKTRRSNVKRKQIRFTYDAFPYMGPALEQEAPKFPELWAGTLRAAA